MTKSDYQARKELSHIIDLLANVDDLSLVADLIKAYKEDRTIILNTPALPLLLPNSQMDTDVYCPSCKKTLSGISSEWEENIAVLQCPHCGAYLNDAIAWTQAKHEEADAEKKKRSFCQRIGDEYGRFYEEDDRFFIETTETTYEYSSMDLLLFNWHSRIKKEQEEGNTPWYIAHWSDLFEFVEKHILYNSVGGAYSMLLKSQEHSDDDGELPF